MAELELHSAWICCIGRVCDVSAFERDEQAARAITWLEAALLIAGAVLIPVTEAFAAFAVVGVFGLEFGCESWRPKSEMAIVGALSLAAVCLALTLALNVN